MLKPISSAIIEGVLPFRIKLIVNITQAQRDTHLSLACYNYISSIRRKWNYFTHVRRVWEKMYASQLTTWISFIRRCHRRRRGLPQWQQCICKHIRMCSLRMCVYRFHGKMNASCIKYFIIAMIKPFASEYTISAEIVHPSRSLSLSLSHSFTRASVNTHTQYANIAMAKRKILNRYLCIKYTLETAHTFSVNRSISCWMCACVCVFVRFLEMVSCVQQPYAHISSCVTKARNIIQSTRLNWTLELPSTEREQRERWRRQRQHKRFNLLCSPITTQTMRSVFWSVRCENAMYAHRCHHLLAAASFNVHRVNLVTYLK